MKYEITKYQIEKLADESSIVKDCLKEWFPEAFKTELELNKWYVYGRSLLNYQGLNNKDLIQAYGFLEDKSWMETSNCGNDFKQWKEATPEEVETALINEAKKRGYKEGVTITWKNKPKLIYTLGDDEFDYLRSNNVLVFGNYGIFDGEQWAEILPQEKTLVPMEKALKIIAKKMKVSPENIEIEDDRNHRTSPRR